MCNNTYNIYHSITILLHALAFCVTFHNKCESMSVPQFIYYLFIILLVTYVMNPQKELHVYIAYCGKMHPVNEHRVTRGQVASIRLHKNRLKIARDESNHITLVTRIFLLPSSVFLAKTVQRLDLLGSRRLSVPLTQWRPGWLHSSLLYGTAASASPGFPVTCTACRTFYIRSETITGNHKN